MRESRSSGSVEGVMGDHDPYSDYRKLVSQEIAGRGTWRKRL
jgi:hypothetical protein